MVAVSGLRPGRVKLRAIQFDLLLVVTKDPGGLYAAKEHKVAKNQPDRKHQREPVPSCILPNGPIDGQCVRHNLQTERWQRRPWGTDTASSFWAKAIRHFSSSCSFPPHGQQDFPGSGKAPGAARPPVHDPFMSRTGLFYGGRNPFPLTGV